MRTFTFNGSVGTIDSRDWIEFNGIGFYLNHACRALRAVIAKLGE
jgi:hypothetical protein